MYALFSITRKKYADIHPVSQQGPSRSSYDGSHWLTAIWPEKSISVAKFELLPQNQQQTYRYDSVNACYYRPHMPCISYSDAPVQYFHCQRDADDLVRWAYGITEVGTLGLGLVPI
jgi:hypothetical protein